MRYKGFFQDGTEQDLGTPVETTLSLDEEAPADLFRGKFPWAYPEKTTGLRALEVTGKTGEVLFQGTVDQEDRTLTSSGVFLSVSARGPAAILLENEAMPQTYQYVSMNLLVKEHGAPYGFSQWKGKEKGFFSPFTISKGMSEWEVLDTFCRQFLNTRLRIRENCLDAQTRYTEKTIRFGGEIPLCSLTVSYMPGKRYSEILLRPQDTNTYSQSFSHPETLGMGIRRRRLLSGTKEEAQAALEKAAWQSFSVEVTAPGEISAALGDRAGVWGGALGEYTGLYVSEILYTRNQAGETCRYTLRKTEE